MCWLRVGGSECNGRSSSQVGYALPFTVDLRVTLATNRSPMAFSSHKSHDQGFVHLVLFCHLNCTKYFHSRRTVQTTLAVERTVLTEFVYFSCLLTVRISLFSRLTAASPKARLVFGAARLTGISNSKFEKIFAAWVCCRQFLELCRTSGTEILRADFYRRNF